MLAVANAKELLSSTECDQLDLLQSNGKRHPGKTQERRGE